MIYKFSRYLMGAISRRSVKRIAYGMAFLIMFLQYCSSVSYAKYYDGDEESEYQYVATIGDATWTDAESNMNHNLEQDIKQYNSLPDDLSLEEATMTLMSLSGGEKTTIINYMDSTMVGAPYNYTGGYTNTYSQGWCCAGAVSRVLYYAYDCKDIVQACSNPSLVSAVRNALVSSGKFELVYSNPNCFTNLSSAQVNDMYSNITQAGDIIIFYGASEGDTPHCGIAGGGNMLYSALVHTGFSPTTIAYYACSGTQGAKAANGMAVYRKKTILGKIRVCKTSADGGVTDGNSAYSFAGAQYAIATSNILDSNGYLKDVVGAVTIEDDADNVSSQIELSPGMYYIQESIPPNNGSYAWNPKVYGPYEVVANKRTTIGIPNIPNMEELIPDIYVHEEISDAPVTYIGGLEIIKESAEGILPVGATSTSGAEFTVNFYAGSYTLDEILQGLQPTRTWILQSKEREDGSGYASLTEEYLKIGSDPLYSTAGNMPLGVITVQETKAPTGYRLEDAYICAEGHENEGNNIFFSEMGYLDGSIRLLSGNRLIVKDQVVRGDIAFSKMNLDSDTPMSGVCFRLTSKTTGESHILMTDENGYVSTSSNYIPHSKNTNGLDSMEGESSTGVWFSGQEGVDSVVRDDVGALPYDTYMLEEIPCVANQAMQLLQPIEIHVNAHNQLAYDGVITNVPKAYIQTRAWDERTHDNYSIAEEQIILHDNVEYKWLKASDCYTVKGVLIDCATGAPVKDDTGEYVTNSMVFDVEPEFGKNESEKCGTITMTYEFSGKELAGKNTVFFEYLFSGEDEETLIGEDGELHIEGVIASHAELEDEKQSIHFASIGTDAFLGEDREKLVTMAEYNRIYDRVSYENLMPKATYRLQAKIMYRDENTGEILPLLDADGQEILGTKTFTTDMSSGTVEVEFPLVKKDSLRNLSYVVYEYLYLNEELILQECTFDNPRQTVTFELPREEDTEDGQVKGVSVEPNRTPELTSPKTGDEMKLKLLVTVGIVTFGLSAIMIILKKEK